KEDVTYRAFGKMSGCIEHYRFICISLLRLDFCKYVIEKVKRFNLRIKRLFQISPDRGDLQAYPFFIIGMRVVFEFFRNDYKSRLFAEVRVKSYLPVSPGDRQTQICVAQNVCKERFINGPTYVVITLGDIKSY